MKRLLFKMCLLFMVLPLSACAQKATFKETITEEIVFGQQSEQNTLVLKNIFGSITIEGYDGSKVVLVADKTIKAQNQEDLESGKQELQLKILNDGNEIIVHPDAPYIKFNREGLGFDWCRDNYKEPKYSHQLDFKVRVPKHIELDVSTVNDGEISIQNMRGGYLKVNNVNGGIELDSVTGVTDLNCINGDVSITYVDNPQESSKYYSLNGDINIHFQKDLSAKVSFKTMNGELYTDFDVERQFMETKKSNENDKAKFRYEVTPKLQIGSGAVVLDFETLNGNVFIKKIES